MTKKDDQIKEFAAAADILLAWHDGDREGMNNFIFPGAAFVEGFTRLRTAVMRLERPSMRPRSEIAKLENILPTPEGTLPTHIPKTSAIQLELNL